MGWQRREGSAAAEVGLSLGGQDIIRPPSCMTAPEPRLMPPCRACISTRYAGGAVAHGVQVLDGLAVHVHDLSVLVNGETAGGAAGAGHIHGAVEQGPWPAARAPGSPDRFGYRP